MERVGVFVSVLQRAAKKRGVLLMGVCNVTPDSFSDGGRYLSPDEARARVDELVREGADAVDIGGESTRPGAAAVSPEEQLARVLPIVRYASKLTTVSVDTTHPLVAEACLDAGACLVNDVSCLADDALADVVARFRAPYVLMHARGPQEKMRWILRVSRGRLRRRRGRRAARVARGGGASARAAGSTRQGSSWTQG